MSDNEYKEDLLRFIQQFSKFSHSVHHAMGLASAPVVAWLQEHHEEIEAARDVLNDATKDILLWAKEHEEELRALTKAIHEAGGGEQFVEQLRERLEQLPESLKQGDFEIALMVIRFSEMADLATNDADELHRNLYEYSTQPDLQDWILQMYDRTGLRPARSSQLEEALALHNEGRFWGSVPLLIATFEGIVTDALLQAGLAVAHSGRIYAIDENGERAHKLSGVHPKLGAAKDATTHEDDPQQLQPDDEESPTSETNRFGRLQTIEFTYGEPGSQLNEVRNAILHGEDVGYATEKRSTQFVFSLYAVLEELVFCGILSEREEVVENGGETEISREATS